MSTELQDAHPMHAHEEDDVLLRPVVFAGIALIIVLILTGVAMFGLYHVMARTEARRSPPANPLAAAQGPRVPPKPRLQANPLKDLEALHKEENDTLTTYGWVDKNAGTVRIPIDRAIDILAERAANAGGGTP